MPDLTATRIVDLIAAVCWAALLALLAVAGGVTTSDGREATGLVLATGIVYAGARAVPAAPRLPLLGGVLGGIVAVAVAVPGIRSGAPLAEPLGYGNANGALLALGVTAAAGLTVESAAPWRLPAAAAGLFLLLVLPTTRSTAATGLAVVAVLAVAVSARTAAAARAVTAAAVTATAALVGGTVVLGAGYSGLGAETAADALSTRRLELWRDAVDITADHPMDGAGLGAFPQLSATARQDADTELPHSLPLELAAEAGIGAGTVVVLLLLVLAARPVLGAAGPTAVAATSSVVVFAAHAAVDYTHHFPAVVLTTAVISGLLTSEAAGKSAKPPPDLPGP